MKLKNLQILLFSNSKFFCELEMKLEFCVEWYVCDEKKKTVNIAQEVG